MKISNKHSTLQKSDATSLVNTARLKSSLVLQNKALRGLGILVRVGGLCIISGGFNG